MHAILQGLDLILAEPPCHRSSSLFRGKELADQATRSIEGFLLDEHPQTSFIEHFRLPREGGPPTAG
jgi:hypothetical protein